MIVLMLGTTAMSSAAVKCAIECAHDSDVAGEIARVDNCCGEKQSPQQDEPRDGRGDEHGPCLSVHCQTAMLLIIEPRMRQTITPMPADSTAPAAISGRIAPDRIFHPPRF